MKTKAIAFAYPSSEIAVKQGFGKSGCYYIKTYNGHTWNILEQYSYRKTKAEVILIAVMLPYPWQSMYTKLYDIKNQHQPIL